MQSMRVKAAMTGAALAGLVGSVVGASAPLAQAQSQVAVKVDGSSTVYPITRAVAQAFEAETGVKGTVAVEFSGTGGGFRKFCKGETDISDASRPILEAELESCRQAGVAFMELPVAFDALTIVVHPKNTWAHEITVAELKKIWDAKAQGKIVRWSQVRPGWPDRPLKLYGPGRDSGTFDYFVEAVLGKGTDSRTDYTASEDDDELVRGVSEHVDALGYFGFAYYEANRGKLKALAVDDGKGAVEPSRRTVETNLYQPLSRPLLIYVNITSSQNKAEVRRFVEFYLKNAKRVVESVGYVPLPEGGYHIVQNHFYRGKRGTVFPGRPLVGLTIRQLLLREASF